VYKRSIYPISKAWRGYQTCGKLNKGESIYANETEIGKVLIDNDYPFALIKYLDKNFDEKMSFKTKEVEFNIKKPAWINL
jgi:hypothetical protein